MLLINAVQWCRGNALRKAGCVKINKSMNKVRPGWRERSGSANSQVCDVKNSVFEGRTDTQQTEGGAWACRYSSAPRPTPELMLSRAAVSPIASLTTRDPTEAFAVRACMHPRLYMMAVFFTCGSFLYIACARKEMCSLFLFIFFPRWLCVFPFYVCSPFWCAFWLLACFQCCSSY